MIVHTSYDGLAALTAVRDLTILLIQKGAIAKADGLGVFTQGAALHAEAATRTSTDANKHAAEALRQCGAEIEANFQGGCIQAQD
ncbi:MAG: hypothetical protein LBV80_08080 [Deltaproteobacteria bacterium]|jgi:hypothetical protein|nr:hypothetical protein [Deltaproteobacteria bacterium]